MTGRKTAARVFCIAMTVIFLSLAIVCWLYDGQIGFLEDKMGNTGKNGAGALVPDAPLRQYFTASRDGLVSVTVKANSVNAKALKSGVIVLSLYDGDRLLAQSEYAVPDLKKNRKDLTLTPEKPLSGVAGKSLCLTATSDCSEGKGVTLRADECDVPPDGAKLILQDGSEAGSTTLYMITVYETRSPGLLSAALCLLISMCFAFCLPLCLSPKGGR